jgi:predicted O-methyltransferase YrrM
MPTRPAIAETLAVLERQRQEQQAANAARRPADGQPGPEPRNRDALMLAVGPESGRFLNTLLRGIGAKLALEIGGSMGYSTLWQAEALEHTGGRLITLEAVSSKVEILRENIRRAGVENTVEVRAGDARELIRSLPGPFDFVLIDAWKEDYPTYLELVFPKLRVGGLIVADNITRPSPPDQGITSYLERVRSLPNAQSQLIPIGSGLELTVKLG